MPKFPIELKPHPSALPHPVLAEPVSEWNWPNSIVAVPLRTNWRHSIPSNLNSTYSIYNTGNNNCQQYENSVESPVARRPAVTAFRCCGSKVWSQKLGRPGLQASIHESKHAGWRSLVHSWSDLLIEHGSTCLWLTHEWSILGYK